jgi:hypothetical protein
MINNCPAFFVSSYGIMRNIAKLLHFNVQEIKFEPNVMCEVIDKKLTFRSSQVCQFAASIQRSCLNGDILLLFKEHA